MRAGDVGRLFVKITKAEKITAKNRPALINSVLETGEESSCSFPLRLLDFANRFAGGLAILGFPRFVYLELLFRISDCLIKA